jgi:hypothetical protein
MATVFNFDSREFNATLRRYKQVSQASWPDICNRKALFIAMGAQNQTPKAGWGDAREKLGAIITTTAIIGKRGPGRRMRLSLDPIYNYYDTLAVKIVVARLRRAGKPIPSAGDLKAMALQMIRVRAASVAFIKSGWRPAIQILKRRTRGTPAETDPAARQIGVAKGGAEAAKKGDMCRVVIFNLAQAKKFGTKHKNALFEFGGPALARAFAEEQRTTEAEIEKRMRADARDAGIKTN